MGRLIDADALLESAKKYVYQSDMTTTIALGIAETWIKDAPAVDAVPIVRCRDCKHKKLDGPSTCKSIVNEFYCDEKLGWLYQYEGEPDILDWFCADGEQADSPTCGPDYCEIGGEDDAR